MASTLLLNGTLVNEGKIFEADILIANGRIERIGKDLQHVAADQTIDATGLHILPGLIDDQVHFREPGLTHKAEIYTESRAAVAGGITSFMEMPNTVPNTLTQELLQHKYDIAARNSIANYSFFMGASNDNIDEVLKTNPKNVCGVKIFMGSSTGNMLVDNQKTLEHIFSNSPTLIATHCESEEIIRANTAKAREQYGEQVPMHMHPVIRNEEACYASSSAAIALAKKTGARLHILHISTGKETLQFDNSIPLKEKKITAEACVHHLWFTDADYAEKGSLIKWNPAVKTATDREMIRKAVNENRIDVLATDHAPHTLEEKQNSYFSAPSGGPLVQHNLPALLDLYHQGVFSLEKIVEKSAHAVAELFEITNRGYIREGYQADLVVVNLNKAWEVHPSNLLYKCGWSPFEGHQFKASVEKTFVNGHLVYSDGQVIEGTTGERLLFSR
ncbi:MAG: dihydroorotase [Bacteroidota bacterium]|uniref:Dihydroorotase n=2 Tax=Roseivirga TaxID=290180 RepID=A0ABQ3I0C0_9BACT|nr:dihydroorotase [Roseivirga thermotolerans]MEC7756157.1 dihydroorotase [Bacteroidota bacterium]GHE50391.1 dihydroorotase [Roseivirga thermotolerans]